MLAPDPRGEPGMFASWLDVVAFLVRLVLALVLFTVGAAIIASPVILAILIMWRTA